MDHPREGLYRLFDGTTLRDVVDAALNDDGVCAVHRRHEARGDLIASLAIDAVVAELERRISFRRPPLPLAPLVGCVDPFAHSRVRIPQRRTRCDRVAEAGDDHGRRIAPAR
jgi:hypothetical protein